jgi:hypothetical protein
LQITTLSGRQGPWSAIASFILLLKSSLDGLGNAAKPQKRLFRGPKDTYWDYLSEVGREVADYQHSGYVLATLLSWLKDIEPTC